MKKQALIIIIVFNFICLFSQPSKLGIPFIKNYTIDDYKADNQNWGIVQDSKGIVYFANNWGVLQYNGSDWRIIASADNFSNIRSLSLDSKGILYAGAFNEFGYLDFSRPGISGYHSLIKKIPVAYRKFNDIWDIHQSSDGIYFHSSHHVFCYKNDTIEVTYFKEESKKSFLVHDRLFLVFQDGIKELKGGRLIDMPLGSTFASMYIAFMLPFSQHRILIGTESNGLYLYDFQKLTPFHTEIDELINRNKLYCGIYTSDGSLALGTVHGGLMITDLNGHSLLHLNTENGLQNNTILALKNDNLGNLWLTHDQGIDYVELASPFTKIKSKQIDGNIYSICHSGDHLYVATHHGLFYQSWNILTHSMDKLEEFNQVSGVSEINWNLSDIDGTLFLGHDKGAYTIHDGTATKISDIKGGWTFRKLQKIENTVIEGTYNGIVVYKKENGQWKQFKYFNLNESCRILEEDDDGNIWLTSGYAGVYRIRLNESADSITFMKLYKAEDGFPESVYFGVFKIKGEVVFGTQKGAFTFNPAKNRIEPHALLNTFFKDLHVRKLTEDRAGNIWYIASKNTGYLKLNADGSYTNISTPFQKIRDKQLAGFENITFADDNNVMIGTRYGIINFNQSFKRDYFVPFQTIIDKVYLGNGSDSVLYQTALIADQKNVQKPAMISIPYSQNALRFKYVATFFENNAEIEYQYKLEGFDDDWSTWQLKNEKEYTNIPEGTYTFKVKSRNIYDFEGSEASIRIVVLPPWYRSIWAYIVYIVTAVLVFWLIIAYKNRQFEKEKTKLEEEKQKAMKFQLREHMQEKLEDELKNKNNELASTAMSLVQRNETIIKVRDKLIEISNSLEEKEQKKLKVLEEFIEDEINDDSYWDQFESHFNQIHDDFIKRLKSEHTSLTHRDLKMCAYLRMNLENKEIASLLNITLRGVEASRLRLRKKLDLDKDTLLTEYILRY